MVKLDANHDWWANFLNFRLTDPITITEANRYLHILHYRSKLNDTWLVCLNVDFYADDKYRTDGQNAKEGVWEDVVIDLKKLMDDGVPLTKFMFGVSMDWNGPRDNPGGDYYFDEIVMNNNPLPRGATILPDTEMSLFFGNTASYTKWVSKFDLQNTENTSEIVDNPFTTELPVLNSPKILKFNKSANAAWWQGVRVKLPGLFQVGVGVGVFSYLHVMVNIPDMEVGKDNYVIQLNAKDFTGKQIDSGDLNKYWSDDKGKWFDFILDVTSLGYVSEFTVRCDVRKDPLDVYITSPAGAFYIDAVAINNSPDARTVVNAPTGITPANQDNTKIYSVSRNIVVEGNVASIEVYSLLGKLVNKVTAKSFKTELTVNQSGAYLVKTKSANGNVYNAKVLIK